MVKRFFDNGWEIHPAGGVTGQAFFARYNDEKLFLKRNSSPFLAVLSAERIVPKLVWTKRLENGDVITAQQWINGRILEPGDMNEERVAKLLRKIHRSKPLLSMLHRLGKKPVFPEKLIFQLEKQYTDELKAHSNVQKTFQFLQKHQPAVRPNLWSVCHGDVNHNNWMVAENNELYLIDWDNAIISDPAIDIGPLLYWYIPEKDWKKWLNYYGISLNNELIFRLKWYMLYQTLYSALFYYNKGKKDEGIFWIEYLDTVL